MKRKRDDDINEMDVKYNRFQITLNLINFSLNVVRISRDTRSQSTIYVN